MQPHPKLQTHFTLLACEQQKETNLQMIPSFNLLRKRNKNEVSITNFHLDISQESKMSVKNE